ncbi:MAG: AbrB/MazE/SpoVT family DNA-binding domain-containing protein [Promethearchaeota archaeon]
MNTESKIDEKGRICIPIEIRKMLNIKAGEKLFFQVKDDKIILRKSTSVKDFIKKSDEFGKKLKNITSEPIEFKKIFE